VGTKKFEEFDHKVIGLADLYLREHPEVSVKAAIRAVVEQCWNSSRPVGSKHDFYGHEQIGASIPAACQRTFARLREDLAEAYPIARRIEKRVRKTPGAKESD
jgi:hypothetical protein